MKIEIDISGQIQQLNLDSALGIKRSDGLENSVFLKSEIKKEIIKKYKGQITSLIEKLHCILIYYCIKDNLNNAKEIIICRDVSFRRIKNLLPLLFKEQNYLNNIKIIQRASTGEKSLGHKIALKTLRNKKIASVIINKEMIENVLLEFKKSKSGHPKMRTPIMLCLKAKGIRTAPPGNPYNIIINQKYIKLSF